MRRTLYPLLALCLVTMLLASCVAPTGTGAPVKETVLVAKERTTVEFWHMFGSGPKRDMIDKLVGEFNATSPDYVVEPVFADFWTYEQKALAAIAAGEPPDVIMVGNITLQANAQQIIPLDDYIARDGLDMSGFWEYSQKDVTYDGHVWGIPWGADTRLFYYNKDFFAEVGLDPDQPPVTWDELYEYALKLDVVDDEGNLVRVGFNPQWGNCWAFTFLHSNGAILMDDNGEPHLEDIEVLETIKWYKQWVDHYGNENLANFAAGFGGGAQDPFLSGQVAMIIQTNSYVGTIEAYAPDLNWATAMVPYNRTPGTWGGGGSHLRIPVGAKNPEGAWAFIKHFTSEDAQLAFALGTGVMPARVDAASDPSLIESVQDWDVVLETMKITRALATVIEVPHWIGPLHNAFGEVWDGIKEPEQALADAQDAVLTEIANYKATH